MPRPHRPHCPAFVLLDAVQQFLRATFGPDDQVAEVRITTEPPRVLILTDHGARIAIDLGANPSDS